MVKHFIRSRTCIPYGDTPYNILKLYFVVCVIPRLFELMSGALFNKDTVPVFNAGYK